MIILWKVAMQGKRRSTVPEQLSRDEAALMDIVRARTRELAAGTTADSRAGSRLPSETPHAYLTQLQAILQESRGDAKIFAMGSVKFLSRRVQGSGGKTHAHLVADTPEGAMALWERLNHDTNAMRHVFGLADDEGITVGMTVQKELRVLLAESLRCSSRKR